jgi:hypothetical protein
MTPAEEHRFQDLVQGYFAAHGQAAVFVANGALSLNGKLSAALCLDLESLHAKCTLAKPREWESIVRRHFDSHLGLAPGAGEPDRLEDLDEARDLLFAAPSRLDEDQEELARGRGLVYRRDLEGLPTVLFLKTERGLEPVTKRLFEKWGKRPSELFRIALKNARRELKLDTAALGLPGGRKALRITSDSGLMPACVYFLGALPGAAGKLGAIFAIPHARCVIAHRVEQSRDIEELAPLILEAAIGISGASEVLSRDAYHWNGRGFERIESPCARKA